MLTDTERDQNYVAFLDSLSTARWNASCGELGWMDEAKKVAPEPTQAPPAVLPVTCQEPKTDWLKVLGGAFMIIGLAFLYHLLTGSAQVEANQPKEITTMAITPGEWVFDAGDQLNPSAGPPVISVEHRGEVIVLATLSEPAYSTPPVDEWDDGLRWIGDPCANGSLMAAAPNLLAACETVLADIEKHDLPTRASVLAMLRDAVAKARKRPGDPTPA